MNIPPELFLISLILIVIIYYNSRKKSKSFKVFKHRTKGYKAVKVGIAWLATIFMPIWFLFRGLWSIFFTYIILLFIAVAIDEARYGEYNSIDFNNASNEDFIWVAIQFIFFILPLFKGNDWTAKHLVKKGYLLIDSVDAISKANAIAIVLDSKTDSSDGENNTFFKKSKKSKKTDDKFTVMTHLNDKSELSVVRYAADIGVAESQYILALMYYLGKDTPIDFKEAAHWAQKAAIQDFPEAQMFLAGRYFDGKGVDINEEIGKEWLERAAQSSDSEISKMAKKELEDFKLAKRILKNIDPEFLK